MNLESFLDEDLKTGRSRKFGATFRRAVKAFQKAGVPIAVAGSVAYSFRVEPTYTQDIDVLADPDDKDLAWKALLLADFEVIELPYMLSARDRTNNVDVDVMLGYDEASRAAFYSATDEKLFGVEVAVIEPESILWMCLQSPHGRHKDRALTMLRRGVVDVDEVRGVLAEDGDNDSLKLLKQYINEARRPPEGWRPKR